MNCCFLLAPSLVGSGREADHSPSTFANKYVNLKVLYMERYGKDDIADLLVVQIPSYPNISDTPTTKSLSVVLLVAITSWFKALFSLSQ